MVLLTCSLGALDLVSAVKDPSTTPVSSDFSVQHIKTMKAR